jgi:hypothetical protein
MKKNFFLLIITITIATQLNSMEPETPPCFFTNMPTDVMDLIASFLTFDDVETEEQFINRKKGLSCYYPANFYSKTKTITIEEEKELKFDSSEDNLDLKYIVPTEKEVENSQEEICPEEPTKENFEKNRVMPLAWLKKHKDCENDNCYSVVYSANKNICAMTYKSQDILKKKPFRIDTLSIVNTKTDEEINNITIYNPNHQEKYLSNLAISSNGNIYAKIYVKRIAGTTIFESRIKIKNLQTQKKEYPVEPNFPKFCITSTIAFNKQDTHLIMHKAGRDPILNKDVLHHAIIPLTTTLENKTVPQQTLGHYFAHKKICKNLTLRTNK